MIYRDNYYWLLPYLIYLFFCAQIQMYSSVTDKKMGSAVKLTRTDTERFKYWKTMSVSESYITTVN